jgi:N-acetylglucosaminyldiphosphoundecaprenol N-acetyl-beta-D-mannosaminyltransferase
MIGRNTAGRYVEAVTPAYRACGVRIDVLPFEPSAHEILRAAQARRALSVHLCNAYTLALASRDQQFAALVDRADLNVMDGAPLVWLARRLGFDHVDRRVYGPELMLEVMRLGRASGLQHYLYGSTREVVSVLGDRLRARLPGLAVAGAESPPFRDLTVAEERALVDRIVASQAHIVWVGLGTPKQDLFVDRFRGRVPAPLVGVGAAFDFHAGVKRQAPAWMRAHGLEWLYRLATEPRRLWRRYLIGNAVFLAGVLRGVEVLPVTSPHAGSTTNHPRPSEQT